MPLKDAAVRGRLHWVGLPCALALGLCICLFACNSVSVQPGTDPPDPGSGVEPDHGGGSEDPSDDGQTSDDSVGDVVTDGVGGDDSSGHPQPAPSGVAARVRNESAVRGDVTLRFIQTETIVHLAFVRVLPSTVTTIHSPKSANLIELSGVNERGQALASATMTYGADFDDATPAVYTIPGDGSGSLNPVDPLPGDLDPPILNMLEPASDLTLTLGATFLARWTDESEAPGAVVRVHLRSVESSVSDLVPLGPAVGVALDGLNDELLLVVQGFTPGFYEVVGEIDDGTNQATSVAPGRVHVVENPGNKAPTLEILAPLGLVELRRDELLRVAWEDDDDDDNATIIFSLMPSGATGTNVGAFPISPALAEDPDGVSGNSAALTLSDVLPGLYDLVGRISDGELEGVARVERVVRILPEPENDPPLLEITKPAAGEIVEIGPGDSFLVEWEDSDADHNARISIRLDPDQTLSDLDGDEILLATSLGEDEDGAGDAIRLGVPGDIEDGDYRVVGVITDGIVEVVTWARGIVRIDSTGAEPGTEDPPPPEMAVLEPSEPVRVRLGDDISLYLETANIPDEAVINLYLSNVHADGTVRADVTPLQIEQNVLTTLTLPSLAEGIISNDAWPREFRLEVELRIGGEVKIRAFAPASIWIRQEFVIERVSMVNYTCTLNGSADVVDEQERFLGLEIRWSGGGFDVRETPAPVQFWVSNDGTVPADGVDDDYHRRFHTATESPNIDEDEYEEVRVALNRVIGPFASDGDELTTALVPGEYQLITVVETEEFGPITSVHPDSFDVCFRIRDPGSGALP